MSAHGLPPDVNAGPSMLKAIWSMDGIATIVVVLRLVTSSFVLRKITLADYLMVAALVFGISNNICITISEHYGLGRHIMYLTPFQIVHALKWQTIAEPLGILSPSFGRISFAVYMLGLIGTSRAKRWTLFFCIIFSAIVNALCIILIFVQCDHVQKIWDLHAPGKCWPKTVQANYGYFQGACNTLVDLILTILPALIVWRLHLSRGTRIGLAVLLSTSIFAAVASVVKTVKLKSIGAGGDITHNLVSFVIWFTVENNVVIVAASIPTIRPLFTKWNSKNTSSSSGLGSGYDHSGYQMGSYGYQKQSKNKRFTLGEGRMLGRFGAEGGESNNGSSVGRGLNRVDDDGDDHRTAEERGITKETTLTRTSERRRSSSMNESEKELTTYAV